MAIILCASVCVYVRSQSCANIYITLVEAFLSFDLTPFLSLSSICAHFCFEIKWQFHTIFGPQLKQTHWLDFYINIRALWNIIENDIWYWNRWLFVSVLFRLKAISIMIIKNGLWARPIDRIINCVCVCVYKCWIFECWNRLNSCLLHGTSARGWVNV